MPRTIESITDSHAAARKRRAAGQPAWERRARIKYLLDDDVSDENAVAVGQEIATTLRATPWMKSDVIKALARGGVSEVQVVAELFEEAGDVDDLNAALDRMYDLADADRVWID